MEDKKWTKTFQMTVLQCISSYADKHLYYDTNGYLCEALRSYSRKDAAQPFPQIYTAVAKEVIQLNL